MCLVSKIIELLETRVTLYSFINDQKYEFAAMTRDIERSLEKEIKELIFDEQNSQTVLKYTIETYNNKDIIDRYLLDKYDVVCVKNTGSIREIIREIKLRELDI